MQHIVRLIEKIPILWKKIKDFFLENILILPVYVCAEKALNKKIYNPERTEETREYKKLSGDKLLTRLTDEHRRIEGIIEKTHKLLAVAGLVFTLVSFKFIEKSHFLIQILLLYYIFLMIYISIKNLETYQKFGYGTYFEIEKLKKNKKSIIITNLIQMESMATLKSNSNALCVSCLRCITTIILFCIVYLIISSYFRELYHFFERMIYYKNILLCSPDWI